MGFGAFDRVVAAGREVRVGRGVAVAEGGAADAFGATAGGGAAAFGAGAGFTTGLDAFDGFATTTAFGLAFAAAFFAVLGLFAVRALGRFLDGLAFLVAARVAFAFLGSFRFREALALVLGALALRARPFARRDRDGAFFILRVARGAAFLAEARRVLDLAIARGPFSRRRLTKCR